LTTPLTNTPAQYREEWPWWDDLDALWCSRPNYNPTGITNAVPGKDHAAALEKVLEIRTPKRLVDSQPLSSDPVPPSTPTPMPGGKKQPSQKQDSSHKKAKTHDPVDALSQHQRNFKETMTTYQQIVSKREEARLEGQRLTLRAQESRQAFELEMGKQDLEKGEQELAKRKHEDEHKLALGEQDLAKRKHEDEHKLAQKKARFDAAMARYSLLLAQWEQEGKQGARPSIPDWDYM
jgi:hypothetical protein